MFTKNQKGFTLLEILIVLVILGVIAGLAIPAFSNQIEKGRAQEAVTNLAEVKKSVGRWIAVNAPAVAPTVNLTTVGCNAAGQQYDFNPACSTGGALNFDYSVTGGAVPVMTATRNAVNNGAACVASASTLTLNFAAQKPVGAGCYQGM